VRSAAGWLGNVGRRPLTAASPAANHRSLGERTDRAGADRGDAVGDDTARAAAACPSADGPGSHLAVCGELAAGSRRDWARQRRRSVPGAAKSGQHRAHDWRDYYITG